MKILVKSRRYRLTESQFQKLEMLKKYNIKESQFVRQAIDEKFNRDIPDIKIKQERIKLPF